MKYWGKWGAFWGGFWGLLFGAAFFWVPALGPVLVGGPLVAWIVAGLEDAAVVGAHGTSAEAAKAKNILSTLKPTDLTDHVLEPAAQAVTR